MVLLSTSRCPSVGIRVIIQLLCPPSAEVWVSILIYGLSIWNKIWSLGGGLRKNQTNIDHRRIQTISQRRATRSCCLHPSISRLPKRYPSCDLFPVVIQCTSLAHQVFLRKQTSCFSGWSIESIPTIFIDCCLKLPLTSSKQIQELPKKQTCSQHSRYVFSSFPTWQHDHGTMAISPWPTQQTCDLWRRRRRCGSSRLPPGAPNTSWFKMQFLMVFFPKIWWPFQGLKTQNPGQLQSRKEGDRNHPESHDFHHQYPVEAIWDSCAGRMAVFRAQMG